MTIREAVKLYNGTQEKIYTMRSLLATILKRSENMFGGYNLYPSEVEKIETYFNEYIEMLNKQLEQEFR